MSLLCRNVLNLSTQLVNRVQVELRCVEVFMAVSKLLECLERVDGCEPCAVIEVELSVAALREVELELRELLGVVSVRLVVEQAQLSPVGAQDEQEAFSVVVRQALEDDVEVAGVVDGQPVTSESSSILSLTERKFFIG